MAALIEVVGLKKMMIYAMSTLMVGLVLTIFMDQAWQLILIWGALLDVWIVGVF